MGILFRNRDAFALLHVGLVFQELRGVSKSEASRRDSRHLRRKQSASLFRSNGEAASCLIGAEQIQGVSI